MDEGAAAAWPARFNDDEESAIENAMRLRIRDPVTFAAEYQNEPEDPTAAAGEQRLDADAIARKVSGYKRGIVPITATTITAMIDCQATLLYWMVVAWESNFTGYVLDYGSFPDQGLRYFTLASARYTLANIEHEGVQLGASIEARLRKGLDLLVGPLLERRWKRDDGAELQIDRLLIDAGYKTSVVFKFAREHAGSARILPSFGRGITAGRKPMSEYKRKPGEKTGEDWIIPLVKRQRSVRHVLFDSNRWKTFFHARLATPIGERGSLSLFEGTPVDHRMIGEHLDAESPTDTFGQGRHCQEWHAKPGRDNHLLDCIVGASVGASIEGVTLEEVLAGDVATTRKKKKLTLGQMRARKRL
jgi:phage terminase large subunit GpA-like protein